MCGIGTLPIIRYRKAGPTRPAETPGLTGLAWLGGSRGPVIACRLASAGT
jgi:hypothetical protein